MTLPLVIMMTKLYGNSVCVQVVSRQETSWLVPGRRDSRVVDVDGVSTGICFDKIIKDTAYIDSEFGFTV